MRWRRFFCVFRRFSKQFQSAWEVRAWRALTVEERVDLLRFEDADAIWKVHQYMREIWSAPGTERFRALTCIVSVLL